jgi:hypothetical protein
MTHFVMGPGTTQPQSNQATRHVIVAGEAKHTHVLLKRTHSAAVIERGRKAWDAIHSYTGDDPKTFLRTFEATIPNYGCSCMRDYREYKAANPPDFSSPEAFFAWGVDLHNWVNEKLIASGDTTKRKFTIEEARNQWRRE